MSDLYHKLPSAPMASPRTGVTLQGVSSYLNRGAFSVLSDMTPSVLTASHTEAFLQSTSEAHEDEHVYCEQVSQEEVS